MIARVFLGVWVGLLCIECVLCGERGMQCLAVACMLYVCVCVLVFLCVCVCV